MLRGLTANPAADGFGGLTAHIQDRALCMVSDLCNSALELRLTGFYLFSLTNYGCLPVFGQNRHGVCSINAESARRIDKSVVSLRA